MRVAIFQKKYISVANLAKICKYYGIPIFNILATLTLSCPKLELASSIKRMSWQHWFWWQLSNEWIAKIAISVKTKLTFWKEDLNLFNIRCPIFQNTFQQRYLPCRYLTLVKILVRIDSQNLYMVRFCPLLWNLVGSRIQDRRDRWWFLQFRYHSSWELPEFHSL